jgi:hypothetical protein
MMRLQDFAPTKHENDVLFDAVHPWHEQVAIGYLRAWRHAHGGKRSDGRPIMDFSDLNREPSKLSDIFGDLFTKPGD